MIQRRMGAEYQAEVALKYTHPTENYVIIVEGRADGIIEQNGETTIDEIKGTYRDLAKLKAPLPLHIAQAKCYAYMYSLQKELPYIRVRLTYCNIETEDIRYFYEDTVTMPELLADMAKDRIILVATHVVSDVETVATKVILLRAGKIVDAAPVPELIEKYAPDQGLEDVYLNVFGEGDGK